jgi:diacylglycerol O-acyltransferase / wax synthase
VTIEQTPHAVRPRVWREGLVGLALFTMYLVVAAFVTSGRRDTANSNAETLLAFEQWLHIDVEKSLNSWLVPRPVLTVVANYEYAYTYIIGAFGLLAWLYVRYPEDYRRARDSFIVLNVLGIGCFALFPVTPPRLMHSGDYVDTVARGATFGSWGTPLMSSVNQFAAMPSLHVAWALWVSVVLARLARGIAVQLLSAANVAVTAFVIIPTANHFLLDAVAAIPLVWVSVAVVDRRRPDGRASPVPSADAFFLHVETDAAPQHVGGMVVLAASGPGTPTVDEVRALVQHEIAAMPRFRQRLHRASAWHRWRWVDVDPRDIDWEWHVSERVARTTGAGTAGEGLRAASAALSRTVAEIATERMPRDRPMWRIVLVREITPGRSGLLFLVHHCVADGVGTVVQALHILRPPIGLPGTDRPTPGAIRTALATAVGLAQLATDGTPAAKLPPGSPSRQFATTAFDLATVRNVAHSHGVRVTDVVLWLVATALERTHPTFCEMVKQRLRVSVPIMLREPGSTVEGNLTAAAMMDLALTEWDPQARLADIHRCTARMLTPTRALASRFVMANALGVLPAPVQRGFARAVYGSAFLQAIMSNMPGPTPQMSIVDVPFERVVPILPLAPGAPIALGALSWTGVLGVGIAVDPAFLDADTLAAAMEQALRELAGTAGAVADAVERQ